MGQGEEADRPRQGARARARSWALGSRPGAAAPSGWISNLPWLTEGIARRLQHWLAYDLAPGRLIPWLPIAFGLGVALYFSADNEPQLWAGGLASCAAIALCIVTRARPLAWPLSIGFAALVIGFTFATWKTARVAHPVLAAPAYSVVLSGFVESREDRERTDRFTLRIHRISGLRGDASLQRVRLSVRKGMAPTVASFVELRARLTPPLAPLRPGGYDFARDHYFQRLGASGFVLGQIKQVAPPHSPDLWLRYAAAVGGLRDAIDARIRATLADDKGAIASALITGKRDAISSSLNDAMYVSSLAHVLSISGYHMALVAGAVFFVVRAGLALFPSVVSRYSIKKWAALAALLMAFFYLLLSGAEVATQRAFIMTAIVLVGVMFDRPALTLRTIAVAALVLLAISPEALVHPSFQMSFAATLALVAAYERGLPWLSAAPKSSLGARVALWGGREITALVLASIVAGFATTLFAAYHFHRLAPYGVVANLLAMPVVSLWIMPAGLLGLIAIPFGFDRMFWWLMGEGIEWMISVALFVSSLPGAVGRIAAFGIGPLLLGTAGLTVVCLLRSPLRWTGVLLGVACVFWAAAAPKPDILVAPDAGMVAVRAHDGKLRLLASRRDNFMLREWLAADGDARLITDQTLTFDTRCDSGGCVARLPDGRAVSLAFTPEATAEDCELAVFVATNRIAPPSCAAMIVDRTALRVNGVTAATRSDKGFLLQTAIPQGRVRPWTPLRPPAPGAEGPASTAMPRDATPRPQDLDAEDAGATAPE